MHTIQTTLRVAAVAALFAATAIATRAADSAWPDKVVTFEELHPLTPFDLRYRRWVAKGRVIRPASMRVHVDASGAVARVVLLESCGNGDLDESALHAMRDMRFKPYLNQGTPSEVTLVVPVHIPKRLGRSD